MYSPDRVLSFWSALDAVGPEHAYWVGRRTVRALLRGPDVLLRRARRPRPRRLVLLVDVSGSMSPYADALLRFAHALVRHRPRWTAVYALGTRLTPLTAALRTRDVEA